MLFQVVLTGATCAWIAALTWKSGQPFLFPSLGASTFIVLWVPHLPPAAPRNAICSHVVGAVIGWLALTALGHANPWFADEPLWLGKIGAPTVALGATCFFMHTTGFVHPPAGATTLGFAMGMLTNPLAIGVVGLGAVGVCASAWIAHRAMGRLYPLWSPMKHTPASLARVAEELVRRSA